MPPKAKFTREEIISAALEIARESGISAITARELGTKLGSSARPVFTVFHNMEEVHTEVINAAREVYNQYAEKGLSRIPAFKHVGIQYISFAIKEPKLFQLLFMEEPKDATLISQILPVLDDNFMEITASIQDYYKVNSVTAQRLYRHLWIYTHGIAVLCATNVCGFDMEEIEEMMTEVFVSLLKNFKTGESL